MIKKGVVALLFCSVLIGCGSSSHATSPISSSNLITSVDNKEYKFSTYYNGEFPLNNNSQIFKGEIADPSIVKGDDGRFYVFSTLRRQKIYHHHLLQ
jgi:hypothetical protein